MRWFRAPALNRRDAVKLVAVASGVLVAPVWAVGAPRLRPDRNAAGMIVVADPRWHHSLRFAQALEREGARLVPRGRDLAAPWFDVISPALNGQARYVAGLTLQSDLFVLERLAEGSGAALLYHGAHDWRGGNGLHHRLSGRIVLDPIVAALTKEDWATGVARALGSGDLQACTRQDVDIKRADAPPADGPRYWVSWLMGASLQA